MAGIRVALCQINSVVGDITDNTAKIIEHIDKCRGLGAQLIVFPELAVCGYPPEDLVFRTAFLEANLQAILEISKSTGDVVVICGFVNSSTDVYNAAAIMSSGAVIDVYNKIELPNYGVFDEMRYFQSGRRAPVYLLDELRFGVTICEDIWYPGHPAHTLATHGGAHLIVNLSASPFHIKKPESRENMLSTRASDNRVYIAYCNLVGAQDELVFDGSSVVLGPDGTTVARAPMFKECTLLATIDPETVRMQRLQDPRQRFERKKELITVEEVKIPVKHIASLPPAMTEVTPFQSVEESAFNALVLGTRDYVRKNKFNKVVIGLSGGIDSSIVAVIATEALGAENVVGVSMPSQYSSDHSKSDAAKLAENLGIEYRTIPINDVFDEYRKILKPEFCGKPEDTTEENIQARIRGNFLMALSNKFGWLVLTTGNKSEMSMGYATLYGDMAGGFAVIKDVYKTMVFRICRWYNAVKGKEVIPESVIRKLPSAELRPGQFDEDSLPPYAILDEILKCYIEREIPVDGIVERLNSMLSEIPDIYDVVHELAGKGKGSGRWKPRWKTVRDLVVSVLKTVDRNEYKRRQAPPGIKITPRAFGRDRRLPITNRFGY